MSFDGEHDELRRRYEGWPTEDLLQVLGASHNYRPEAVQMAREVLATRDQAEIRALIEPDEEPSEEQVVQAICAFAAERMERGSSAAEVEAMLVEQGLDRESAATVVAKLATIRAEAAHEAGKKNMLYGALVCIGGIVVTAVTYGSAAASGGGTYVVAWGAIVFGAIQFFHGLSQMDKVTDTANGSEE
jgi:hypothetical protein